MSGGDRGTEKSGWAVSGKIGILRVHPLQQTLATLATRGASEGVHRLSGRSVQSFEEE